jgi:Flp pilus assembly protein TadG
MKLKSRRGAIVVMLGIMAVTLMSISAISIDFSRLWTLRNELQTSADAAAHAGAVQLSPPNNAGATDSVVRAYGAANLAMQGTVTVDSVIFGNWDDTTKTFTPSPPAPSVDAVSVTVSRQSTGLMMAFLGVTQPRIKARAVGWANAPVQQATGCIKPWAIPYTLLMYKINVWRNANGTGTFSPPNSTANLTRPFDQVADIDALNNMPAADRTFSLKQGSGYMSDSGNTISGNYQSVILPEFWDAATQSNNPNYQPSDGGGMNYANNIAGTTCNQLDIGDRLVTEQGVAVGPTIHGFLGTGGVSGPGICAHISGHQDAINKNDSRYGDCVQADGSIGVDVKAAFFYCSSNCNGKSEVEVKMLGSFTLKKIYPQGDSGQNPQWDASEIVGIFKPTTDPGTVGPGNNMFTTIIIAR